jgi:hypothetical protein
MATWSPFIPPWNAGVAVLAPTPDDEPRWAKGEVTVVQKLLEGCCAVDGPADVGAKLKFAQEDEEEDEVFFEGDDA